MVEGQQDPGSAKPRQRPRLLYLAVYDPGTPLTGTGVRGNQFIRHLALFFDLDIVHLEGSGQPPNPKIRRSFPDTLPGLQSRTAIPFSAAGYFLFSPALLRKARELIRQKTYALIFCDYGLSAFYGRLLSKESGIPWVYSSHNVEFRVYLQKARRDFRRWILLPWVWWNEKRGVASADRVIAITPDDARQLASWTAEDRIRIVPQGFDPTLFHPAAHSDLSENRTLLFCGNFNIQFNQEAARFIRDKLVEPVAERFSDVRFLLVGQNPPALEPHPALACTGFVEDYPSLLRGAHAMISPMVGGGGFPTKVIEALACGKTVLATPTGARGLPPHLKQLRIHSLDDFPDQLTALLEHPAPLPHDDFEEIRRRFSWSGLLNPLCKEMQTWIKEIR